MALIHSEIKSIFVVRWGFGHAKIFTLSCGHRVHKLQWGKQGQVGSMMICEKCSLERVICPRCGTGVDSNGDGDCMLCARVPWQDLPIPLHKLSPRK
jgi:hypothetical protein